MTLLDDRPDTETTLEEALAELDSAGSIADRRKRAAKRARELEGLARGRVIFAAGLIELDKALQPLRGGLYGLHASPGAAEVRAAEIEAGQGVDKLVFEQCMIHLRAEDLAEVYRDPDRMESERNWQAYLVQVRAAAFVQGNKGETWTSKWQEMVAERADAVGSGDPVGVLDRRLERHVGVPYPVAPEASWESADTIPMKAEREAEFIRLEKKYGPRPGTPTTDAPTSRRRVRK